MFATSKEINLKLITTTGSGIDPNRKSTLNSEEYKSFAPAVQGAATASLEGALAWPTSAQSPVLMQSLSDALSQMIANNGSPKDTMAKVNDEWVKTIG